MRTINDKEDLKKIKEEAQKSLRVGDLLEIVDNGYSYTTYGSLLGDAYLMSKYKENHVPSNNTIYKIVGKYKHERGRGTIVYGVENKGGQVYLINSKGIKPSNDFKNKFHGLRERRKMIIPNMTSDKINELKEILLNGAYYDGAHHKQEYILKALELLQENGFETGDLDEFREEI